MGEEPVAADLGERVLGRVELLLGFDPRAETCCLIGGTVHLGRHRPLTARRSLIEATLVSGRTIAQPGFVLHSVLDATDIPLNWRLDGRAYERKLRVSADV